MAIVVFIELLFRFSDSYSFPMPSHPRFIDALVRRTVQASVRPLDGVLRATLWNPATDTETAECARKSTRGTPHLLNHAEPSAGSAAAAIWEN